MSHTRRRGTLLLLPFIFTLILALAACGTNASPTSSTSSPSAGTPTRTTPPTKSTGCPGKQAMLTPPPAATVMLTADFDHRSATVQRGDTVEVRLSSSASWNGSLNPAQGILTLQSPGGAIFPAAKACFWRYVAVGRGTATLLFKGSPICQPTQACPSSLLLLFQFVITVT